MRRLLFGRDNRPSLRAQRAIPFLLLCCLVLAESTCLPAVALDPNRSLRQLHHTSWNASSGVSGNVLALAQTTDGFLWVGTSLALYRFDGVSFERYQLPDGSLPFSEVKCLLATPDGGLWVGHRTGVAFIKNGQAQVYTEKQGLPYGRIRGLARTQDGSIWAGVVGGFARLHDGKWQKIRWAWNYPENTAIDLLVDQQGTLWVATGSGIRYLPAGETRFHEVHANLSAAYYLVNGPNGTLWATEPDKDTIVSLSRHPQKNGPTLEAEDFTLHRMSIGTLRILFDRDGSFWAVNDAGQGIRRYTASMMAKPGFAAKPDTAIDRFSRKDGLSGNNVYTFLEDREGNMWVGTDSGLDRFRNRNAVQIDYPLFYYTLMEGVGSDVWLGPGDPSRPFVRGQDGKPLANVTQDVLSSFIDRTGTLWYSTAKFNKESALELWRFRNGKLDMIPGPLEIPHPYIKGILSDFDGRLWLAVSGHGEYTWKDGIWNFVPVFQGKDSDLSPDRQFMDAQGRVWLTYYARQCVALIDHGKATVFNSANGLNVGGPTAGAGGPSVVWVAGTAGISFFDGKRFHNIRGVDGNLFSNSLEILPTDKNGLWLEGSEGVIEIAQSEIAKVLHGETNAVTYRTFDSSTDFTNTLSHPNAGIGQTALEGGDGKLWFLTQEGVSWIDPSHLVTNELPPPVSIRSVTAGDIVYSAMQAIKLPANTRNLSIDYTALSLTLSERNQFRYRLEGFDKDWQEAKTRRQAYYTNLSPGTYHFHVTASNNDGIWNTVGATEELTIPPTFIQTVWFRLIVAVAFACVLILGFNWRLRLVEHRVREQLSVRLVERERIARELHDTLLQGFQGLVLRFLGAALTMTAEEPARAMIEKALRGADDVLTEGRNRVRDLRTERSEILTLEEQLQRAGEELSIGQNTSFVLSLNGNPRRIHQVVFEEAYATAREALINAFIHSAASLIQVHIDYSVSSLTLKIQDNGKGIDKEVLKSGKTGHFGMSGMKERAIKMKAALRVYPGQSSGTIVELVIPARVAYFQKSGGRVSTFHLRLLSRYKQKDF
jgi:signal transduction histidine kinase/ligand-binding sensor domain-containing protein